MKVELPPWKVWKADVSSVSPSSERIQANKRVISVQAEPCYQETKAEKALNDHKAKRKWTEIDPSENWLLLRLYWSHVILGVYQLVRYYDT